MKIAFVTCHDVNNKVARSGVPYSIYHELGKHYEMIYIVPNPKDTLWHKFLFGLSLGLRGFMKLLGWNYIHNPIQAYLRSKSVEKQLKNIQYDAVFSLDGPAISYIKIDKPIFLRADAIAPSAINYYKYNVPWFARKWAISLERKVLGNLRTFFVASQWMIEEIEKYKIGDVKKCLFVPTGANLDMDQINFHPHNYSLEKPLNMLFVGYDYKRKGFDVAYDAMKMLREKYIINANLTIVGGKPDKDQYDDDNLRIIGKLNKNIEKEYSMFYNEFSTASLFIFPTKAEYHGIVNCEAAAFGLPIFSYNTGGVSSYCMDGYNGRCLPLDSDASSFAKVIFEALQTGKICDYSKHSRELFENKFNWTSWAETVVPNIDKAIIN